MTREIKLAMVIGLALLLLAGIVISDHLSPASERLQPLQESAQPLRLAAEPPAPPALREVGRAAVLASPPSPPPAPTPTETIVIAPLPPSGVRPAAPPRDPLAAAPAARTPAVLPDSERTYRVQEGDALTRIAATLYGDASLWEALAAYNRDRLPDPNRMRPGLVLRIPPADRLGGPAASRREATERGDARGRPRTRLVRDGETLSQIAAETLGSSRRWRELLDANRDRIADPDRIAVGTELRIPEGGPAAN
jgi:nucleoid-associated protein YgaU